MRPLLYSPSGRAGEYSDHGYAANLYKNCSHKCRYCYVASMPYVNRDVFHSFPIRPAPDVLERLKRDMKRVGILPEPVFLCFMCDPYPVGLDHSLTREAIKIITEAGNFVNVLTKGGTEACRDFDLLASSGSQLGATLTFINEELSKEWEPNAALPANRLEMLYRAKSIGIHTWASIEPVIVPDESLRIMEAAMGCVDVFKIGKLNHHPLAKEIDWKKFLANAETLCRDFGKGYVIKVDLLRSAGR